MSKFLHSVIIVVLLSVVLWPAKEVRAGTKVESAPIGDDITVDGNASDWQGADLMYDEDGVRVLGIAHDADSLYLMWKFSDERLAREILVRGVMVWVNGDNKKKETFGLRYGGSEELSKALPPPEGKDFPEGPDPRHFAMMREQFTLCESGFITIFDGDRIAELPENGPDGPRAASALHDGVFVYEVEIPLTTVGGKVSSEAPATDRRVVVGVQVGGLTPDEQKEMRDRMGRGGGPGGMGGPPGGGMGGPGGGMWGGMGGPGGGMGGPRGGGVGGRSGKTGPQDVPWIKVILSPVQVSAQSEE